MKLCMAIMTIICKNLEPISSKKKKDVLNEYCTIQKVILRATWLHMSKSGQSSCGNTIMRRMFIRNDRIKDIFHHMTLLNVMLKTEEAHGVERHHKEIVAFLQFGEIFQKIWLK